MKTEEKRLAALNSQIRVAPPPLPPASLQRPQGPTVSNGPPSLPDKPRAGIRSQSVLVGRKPPPPPRNRLSVALPPKPLPHEDHSGTDSISSIGVINTTSNAQDQKQVRMTEDDEFNLAPPEPVFHRSLSLDSPNPIAVVAEAAQLDTQHSNRQPPRLPPTHAPRFSTAGMIALPQTCLNSATNIPRPANLQSLKRPVQSVLPSAVPLSSVLWPHAVDALNNPSPVMCVIGLPWKLLTEEKSEKIQEKGQEGEEKGGNKHHISEGEQVGWHFVSPGHTEPEPPPFLEPGQSLQSLTLLPYNNLNKQRPAHCWFPEHIYISQSSKSFEDLPFLKKILDISEHEWSVAAYETYLLLTEEGQRERANAVASITSYLSRQPSYLSREEKLDRFVETHNHSNASDLNQQISWAARGVDTAHTQKKVAQLAKIAKIANAGTEPGTLVVRVHSAEG